MKKALQYLFFVFLYLLLPVTLFSQDEGLSIKRFDDVSTVKQYARTQPRHDANGEYAALVLVQVLADVKVDFTGAYLLGDVEKKASEYWVYMAEGAKSLEIHCTGFEKLKVNFSDVSNGAIPSLTKQCTYELIVNVPGMMHIIQTPKRQFFKFQVTPENAVVSIVVDGMQEILPMKEGGLASKMLDYGTYAYHIDADRYHTEDGIFTVSATSNEMTVSLRPQFGWLTLTGDNSSNGAYVFVTNTATGGMKQLGTIPLSKMELESGTYTLRVQKEKYKDYTATITIEDGRTTTLLAALEANFAQVTLTAQEGADILLDGTKLGTTSWSGTLELGEYSVETRQMGYRSMYTTVRVSARSAGQTIALNNPLPIYGSLIVDGSPVYAVVYVDGQQVGRSPMVVSPLLVGEHTIRLEKKGYETETRTVVIEDNKEELLSYTLKQQIAPPTVATPSAQSAPPKSSTKSALAVKEQPSKPSRRINTLVLLNAGASFKSQLWGMGLMFGQLYNGYGWYVKGRSNFQTTPKCVVACDENFAVQFEGQGYVYDYDGDGINDNGTIPFYNENTKATEWIINAGFAMDFLAKREKKNKNNLFGMYLGLGYGRSHYALETTSEMWITYSPWSKQGMSMDVGLMGSIGGFTLAAGVNTINFQYVEAEVSIGWTF